MRATGPWIFHIFILRPSSELSQLDNSGCATDWGEGIEIRQESMYGELFFLSLPEFLDFVFFLGFVHFN